MNRIKKMLVVLGLLVLVPSASLAQGPTYYVDYFSNNAGTVVGAPDQLIRIINVGTGGTPTPPSPVGDICADIFVFDNNQEMVECCTCTLTPNGLLTASVGFELTSNPVTSVVPVAGVIKIALTGGVPCNSSLTASDASLGRVFGTHVQVTGGRTLVTETEKLPSSLSAEEATFLLQACTFVQYLGSGKGKCTCSVPGT